MYLSTIPVNLQQTERSWHSNSLPVLQFPSVSIIPQMLHIHISVIYNRGHTIASDSAIKQHTKYDLCKVRHSLMLALKQACWQLPVASLQKMQSQQNPTINVTPTYLPIYPGPQGGHFNSQQHLSLQSAHPESQSKLTGKYGLVQYLILIAFWMLKL